jgi:hypothetical protein
MAASKQDVEEWIRRGYKQGAKYLVSVCDTFDYDDYPVFVKTDEELAAAKVKYSQNMQRINEVIEIKTRQDVIKDLLESL